MSRKTPYFDLKVKGAFQHAPASKQNRDLVMDLIRKDAEEHHLFFNDEGYHNHLVHQLLADYSLGADGPRLERAYRDNALYQRRKRPVKPGFCWNSLKCLGNENYYSAYVAFFLAEIDKNDIKRTIEYYLFEADPDLGFFARFLSGIYHPMIHLGYGIEFNYPLMVAEGLAWIAVHQPRRHAFFEPPENHAIRATALDIIKAIHQDHSMDGIISWSDDNKYDTVISALPHLLQAYCHQWPVTESLDGTEGLRIRSTELQIMAAAVYAGSHRPYQECMLDFFLLHILTSSLFLHCYIELLEPHYGAVLLRSKFAVDIAWYIAHGRPELHLEQFRTPHQLPGWDEIISKAIASEDDHVPKAVRALIHTSRYDQMQVFPKESYQAMANLTVDDDLIWSTDPIGFDEAWQNFKKPA